MIPEENKKNNDKILYVVLVIIIIIAVALALYKFVFSQDTGKLQPSNTVNQDDSINIERISIKQIDIDFFNNNKFKELEINQVKQPGIHELEIGKNNPFVPR